MAIKATICKATVQISDMDRGFYDDLTLTIAQHPSENNQRMMVRFLAFLLHASEKLKFTEGVSAGEDKPDIWQKNMTDDIEVWIEVGLPDGKKIKKACSRAKQVFVYSYGGRTVLKWWQEVSKSLSKHKNLKVINLPQEATQSLGNLAQRTMTLQCTIQERQVWIGDSINNLTVELETLYSGFED